MESEILIVDVVGATNERHLSLDDMEIPASAINDLGRADSAVRTQKHGDVC